MHSGRVDSPNKTILNCELEQFLCRVYSEIGYLRAHSPGITPQNVRPKPPVTPEPVILQTLFPTWAKNWYSILNDSDLSNN